MTTRNLLTQHSRLRVTNRSINEDTINYLLSFGSPRRRYKADIYMLDPYEKAEILTELGAEKYRRIEKKLRAYVVMADSGKIITAAYRTRRLRFQ